MYVCIVFFIHVCLSVDFLFSIYKNLSSSVLCVLSTSWVRSALQVSDLEDQASLSCLFFFFSSSANKKFLRRFLKTRKEKRSTQRYKSPPGVGGGEG